MDDRKQVVKDFIENRTPSRVPIGFWYHFVPPRDHHLGLKDPKVVEDVIRGQKAYIDQLEPDFVKIMSDGFFGHPGVFENSIETVEDLKKVKSVGENHPWMTEQIAYVNEICDYVDGKILTFYNIFSPLQFIRIKFEEYEEDFEKFTRLFFEDPQVMVDAAREIEKDLKILVDKLFTETKIDGVYYSVQSVQGEQADDEFHKKFVESLDVDTMEHIKQYSDNIMLHICGYGHYTNDLKRYVDYPAKIINWATATENVTLSEGKQIFDGKPVLGGFDNNFESSILFNGTDEELEDYVNNILDDAGTKGVALGADCTIDLSIDLNRLKKIREIARAYNEK